MLQWRNCMFTVYDEMLMVDDGLTDDDNSGDLYDVERSLYDGCWYREWYMECEWLLMMADDDDDGKRWLMMCDDGWWLWMMVGNVWL